jgi:hypothetical protein
MSGERNSHNGQGLLWENLQEKKVMYTSIIVKMGLLRKRR